MGRVLVACFGGQGLGRASGHYDINLERDQFGRESGEPLELPLGISVFDHEVTALDVPEVMQSLTEGLGQVATSGKAARQVAYSSDLGRLLGLASERFGEQGAGDSLNEPSALDHWGFPQVVCESGARRCGACGSRAGSMQELTSLAVRESTRVRARPTSLRRGVPTTPNMTKSGRRQELECS